MMPKTKALLPFYLTSKGKVYIYGYWFQDKKKLRFQLPIVIADWTFRPKGEEEQGVLEISQPPAVKLRGIEIPEPNKKEHCLGSVLWGACYPGKTEISVSSGRRYYLPAEIERTPHEREISRMSYLAGKLMIAEWRPDGPVIYFQEWF